MDSGVWCWRLEGADLLGTQGGSWVGAWCWSFEVGDGKG